MQKRVLILAIILILTLPSTVFAVGSKKTGASEWSQKKTKQTKELAKQKYCENKQTKKEEKKWHSLKKKQEKQKRKEERAKGKEDKDKANLKGRKNAIARITAKLVRMPVAALRGLENALSRIGKWLGTHPPDEEEPE